MRGARGGGRMERRAAWHAQHTLHHRQQGQMMGAQNAAGCDGKQHGGREGERTTIVLAAAPPHISPQQNHMHFTQKRRSPFPPRDSLDFIISLEGSEQWMPLCLLKADNECSSSLRGPSERRDSENLTRTGGRRGREGEAGEGRTRAALLLLLDGGKPFPKQSRQRETRKEGRK